MGCLDGKIAVVTGGAAGIGRGIAEGFAREGADVAIFDVKSESEAASSLEGISATGRRSLYVRTDVSIEDEVRSAVQRVVQEFGTIDILVNNAGIVSEGAVADMPVADWDRVMAVNLRGTFLCTRFVLPGMLLQRSGRIINMASQLGQIGGRSMVHYSASKAGVIGLTKALAREVSDRNVLVNAIAPGPIQTEMLASESAEWKQSKLAELPLGRFGEVADVVPTAIFLASDQAAYYVGQTLGPNGGDVML
ncbi:MAG: 3-oxoacyl-ACP reductase family protein [Candidatus Dormiibacterota bacterium]|jgi:3-oxoacyl-[acyl-carrier protein] reductase